MRKKRLLINLAILFLLVLLILLFLWQLRANLPLREESDKKSQELKEAKAASRHLEELEKQSQDLKEKEEILYRKVPLDEKQPLSLIKMLVRIGGETGLRGISFDIKEASSKTLIVSPSRVQERLDFEEGLPEKMPMQETPQAIPTPAQASSGMLQTGLKSLYLEMNFESTFAQLLSFLERLNNLERLVVIEEIKIERKDEILPYQKVTLELVTYTF